jgi:hypothetical protein
MSGMVRHASVRNQSVREPGKTKGPLSPAALYRAILRGNTGHCAFLENADRNRKGVANEIITDVSQFFMKTVVINPREPTRISTQENVFLSD